MIKLTDNIVLLADEKQYIVGRINPDHKSDEPPQIFDHRYYTTIDTAIKGAISRALKLGVSSGEIQTLQDFAKELNRYKAEFEELLKPLVI